MRISDWSSDVCSSDLAHRIADEAHLVGIFGVEPIDLGIRRRDRIDLARDQAVDEAQYRILLMDRGRNAGLERREQRGKRGIATETDHRLGLAGAIEFAPHRTTSAERGVGKAGVSTGRAGGAEERL